VNKRRVAYIETRVANNPNYTPAHYDRTIMRASGGPVTANQGYWVGENGPEWFTPSTTGMITNHAASRTMGDGYGPMVGGASPVVNVTTTAAGHGDSGPSVLEVRDVDGALIGRMRVEGQRAADDVLLAQSRGVA